MSDCMHGTKIWEDRNRDLIVTKIHGRLLLYLYDYGEYRQIAQKIGTLCQESDSITFWVNRKIKERYKATQNHYDKVFKQLADINADKAMWRRLHNEIPKDN